MILYHASTKECCENIIRVGHSENGHKKIQYDFNGIWATNKLGIAQAYGECMVAIEIVEHLKGVESYPLRSGKYEFILEWEDEPIEFFIPEEIHFKAWIVN